jgi:glycosyltransferase involved in cell wall biosynthesis
MQYFIKYNLINNYYSRIFGSGIDLEHFKPTNIIGERGKTIFLFAGRLIKEKGILDFISAATILKKNGSTSNFVVCGNCEDKNIEEKIIIAKKCRIIEYFGLVDDMKEIIDSVDCVVLPTYYNEGLPRILIEAIAMGRIIITCKQSWTEDILYNNSNGYIAKIKDPDDLAMAMKKVEKLSKEEMQKMGKISINIAKKYFDERNIIESYLSNIDLIKQRKTKK